MCHVEWSLNMWNRFHTPRHYSLHPSLGILSLFFFYNLNFEIVVNFTRLCHFCDDCEKDWFGKVGFVPEGSPSVMRELRVDVDGGSHKRAGSSFALPQLCHCLAGPFGLQGFLLCAAAGWCVLVIRAGSESVFPWGSLIKLKRRKRDLSQCADKENCTEQLYVGNIYRKGSDP